jgi:hypothetical protein
MNDMSNKSASSITRRTVIGTTAAVALGLGLGSHFTVHAAQEASPTPDPEGVNGNVLATAMPTGAPDMELALLRTTIAPGGGLAAHNHPGAILFVVDSGTWGITPLAGTIQLTRAVGEGTPTVPEDPPLGVELILTAGDSLYTEGMQDQMRNAGDDDVVLLMAALILVGQDFQTGP